MDCKLFWMLEENVKLLFEFFELTMIVVKEREVDDKILLCLLFSQLFTLLLLFAFLNLELKFSASILSFVHDDLLIS